MLLENKNICILTNQCILFSSQKTKIHKWLIQTDNEPLTSHLVIKITQSKLHNQNYTIELGSMNQSINHDQ